MKGKIRSRIQCIIAAAVAALGISAPPAHAGVPLKWDPNPAPGIQGGGGVWNTSDSFWDNSGVASVWFNSHDDVAIFGGTAGGTLQLTSAITASAVEFDVAGYSISPAPIKTLTLNSGSVIANVDVSIGVPVSTPGGLFKSGEGTLTLSAAGTIRGTVLIAGGLLAFSAEAQLGGATNDIELAGGGLRYTGSSALTPGAGHVVIVDSAGGQIDTAGAKLLLGSTGQLSGSGTLIKLGTQTLQISAANTGFTGAVNVAGGTLMLQHPAAINGRTITLSGGGVSLRADQATDFQSALSVVADGSVNVDWAATLGTIGQVLSVRDASVALGSLLTVGSSTDNVLGVHNLSLAGNLRLDHSAVVVKGAFTGAGMITLAGGSQPPEIFSTGLIFANGISQTMGNAMSADAGAAGPVMGVEAGTTITYTGQWAGGTRSSVVLRDGGKFVVGQAAHLNTMSSDAAGFQPFIVIGNGQSNTFDLDGAFVADRTLGGTIADGLASLEIRDAVLVTRASASLPVVVKKDGFGGTHRAGSLIFSGSSGARWMVTGADQQYDGAISINSSATFQLDKNLSHSGTVNHKFDGSFQIPNSGATLTKEGAGWLTLSGNQGYAAGTKMQVNAGGVHFDTDPGAGWYAGNYSRDLDGNVLSAPVAAGTLSLTVGGVVEFAAATSHVDALAAIDGGLARMTNAAKTLVAHSVSASGSGQIDLGNGRMIVDYEGANSPLGSVAALIKSGRNSAGVRWAGSGIVSSAAAANVAMGIGYAEASDLLRISGTQVGMFGTESVDATCVLARVTLLGDANLDGRVTFADFQRFELGSGLKNQGWSKGDFNYDGVVDGADFKLLYGNLGKSVALALNAGESAGETPAPQSNSVPEPVGLAYLGGLMALGKRATRRK